MSNEAWLKMPSCVGVSGLVIVLCVAFVSVLVRVPSQAEEPKAKGKEAPGEGQRAREFVAAFDRGDARAVAGFWTPEGDYVDQVGRHFKGQAAIEKL